MKRKQEFETICGVRFARVPHMRRVYNMALGATIDAAEGADSVSMGAENSRPLRRRRARE